MKSTEEWTVFHNSDILSGYWEPVADPNTKKGVMESVYTNAYIPCQPRRTKQEAGSSFPFYILADISEIWRLSLDRWSVLTLGKENDNSFKSIPHQVKSE